MADEYYWAESTPMQLATLDVAKIMASQVITDPAALKSFQKSIDSCRKRILLADEAKIGDQEEELNSDEPMAFMMNFQWRR